LTGKHEPRPHGEGEHLLGEQLPLEPVDLDVLPLDEVQVTGRFTGAGSGERWYYWQIPGRPESLVGYRDPEVCRQKGAEALRADRQRRAMREG